MTWEESALERHLRAPQGVPVEIRCRNAWCSSETITHMRLRSNGGVDIAPFLPGTYVGRVFSQDATMNLGKISPGQYQLELVVGEEVVLESTTVNPGAERVIVWI